MPAIHLIKKAQAGVPAIHRVPPSTTAYSSGNWHIALPRAEALVGGRIYFHQEQKAPAYFGGTITGVAPAPEPENKGRVVFTLEADTACKGVKAPGRWSQEMLVVE